jgi:hypothetical protein
MLLSTLIRRSKACAGDERGSVLIAVLALMIVASFIAVTIGAASFGALQTTNAVAGSVEARGASEAGINAAELSLRVKSGQPGGCPIGGLLVQTTPPAYSVQIAHRAVATDPWTDGCPTGSAREIRLLSTGSAERPIFGSNQLGATRLMEATYSWLPSMTYTYTSTPGTGGGVALYAYVVKDVTFTNFRILMDTARPAPSNVIVRTGDFACLTGDIAGDVLVGAGSLTLVSCNLAGTGYAQGSVSVTNAAPPGSTGKGLSVGNHLLSATSSASAALVTNSGTVGGDVWTAGSTSVLASSTVDGNVVAAGGADTLLTVAGSSILGSAVSTGDIILGKGASVGGGQVSGAAVDPPPPPAVPDWVAIPFSGSLTSEWTDAGYTVAGAAKTPSGSCVYDGYTAPKNKPSAEQLERDRANRLWENMGVNAGPTAINALGCTDGVITTSTSTPITLTNDLVIFANKFTFDKLKIESTGSHKVYFIVPDNGAGGAPTCSAAGNGIHITSEVAVAPRVSVFGYTPCDLTVDRFGWRGQFYGGNVRFNQQGTFTYVPTPPPGYFLGPVDGAVTATRPAMLGGRLSFREVASLG